MELFFRSGPSPLSSVTESVRVGVSGSPAKAWVGGSAGSLGCPLAPCGGFEGCAQPLGAVPHSPGSASLGGFSLKLYFYSC